ncbi:MAG: DUF4363 family protein [Ruminococcaceae bacterium]|nr:DUF4363 family protein [Oscillospiraceae bacterium]
MKSILFASGAIIVLIMLVIANGFYISSATTKLEEMSKELTPNNESAILEISDFWKKKEGLICISVSHNDVDELNIAIEVLLEKAKNGESDGFYEYKARLLNSIIEIRNKERLHIHNIV